MSINTLFEAHLVCPICYEYFIFPTSLHSCGHTFCEDCIYRWRKSQDEEPEQIMLRNTCPVCRTPIVGQARSTAFENMIEACIDIWGNECFTSTERRMARAELMPIRKQELLVRKNEERLNEPTSNQSRYSNRSIYDLIFDSSGEFFGILRPSQAPASEDNDREVPPTTEERPLDRTFTLADRIEINPLENLNDRINAISNEFDDRINAVSNNILRWTPESIPNPPTRHQLSESGEIFYNAATASNIPNNVMPYPEPPSATDDDDYQSTSFEGQFREILEEERRVTVNNRPGNENLSNSFSSEYIDRLEALINSDIEEEVDENWHTLERRYAEEWPFGHLNPHLWNSSWDNTNEHNMNVITRNESSQNVYPNQFNSSFISVDEEIEFFENNNEDSRQIEHNQFLDDSDWLTENIGGSYRESDYSILDRRIADNSVNQEVLEFIARQRLENVTQSNLEDSFVQPGLQTEESEHDRNADVQHELISELNNKTNENDSRSVHSDDRDDYRDDIFSVATNPIFEDYSGYNYQSEDWSDLEEASTLSDIIEEASTLSDIIEASDEESSNEPT